MAEFDPYGAAATHLIKLKGSRPRRWHIKKTAAALDSAAKNARK